MLMIDLIDFNDWLIEIGYPLICDVVVKIKWYIVQGPDSNNF
jgi:hypothetical protein